jgi:GTP pyrophosphokinase
MLRFNDVVDMVESYNPSADAGLLEKAYVFSAKVHRGQERMSGQPYLIHPVEVAGILATMRLDVASVASGFLHDTLEDTLTTLDELRENFGEDIATLVDGVTKISQITFETEQQQQAENFRKIVLALVKDIRVILIKLADRLHNMRTLRYLPGHRQKAIARETLHIYAPIANRLGIDWIKSELENLSFKHLQPREYRELSRKVAKTQKERETYVEEVRGIIIDKLKEFGLQAEVTGRVKQAYSIHQKMRSQALDFHDVYDLTAFRIIVDTVQECYEVLGIIHSLWRPVPGKFKDYIALPKGNMYQSLHTTVIGPYGERIEIQIRTWEMHRIADEGIAAHWKYKEGGRISVEDEKRFTWLRQLFEWHRDLEDSGEFLQTLRVDLFPADVYVFTPRGEVKEFPRGATPVDFAYSIHTEVGHHCRMAKVNGRIVPLDYQLKSGDTVEIITAPKEQPSRDWLRFVKTSRARAKILQWVKGQQRERSIRLGRELCEREFRKLWLNFSKALKAGDLQRAAESFSLAGVDDLLASIGYGKTTVPQVVGRIAPDKVKAEEEREEGRLQKVLKRVTPKTKELITIDGVDDVLVRYAKCCNPVPGDAIVGFITRGRGVTIHTTDCINAIAADPRRRIEARWSLEKDSTFPTQIEIHSVDRKGMLAALSNKLAAQKVNITAVQLKPTGDGNLVATFDIEIGNVKQLRKVLDAVSKVKGVFSVNRIKGWQAHSAPLRPAQP